MKTEVYNLRVSTEVKIGLEREARRRRVSLSAIIDLAARDWLVKAGAETSDEQEQARIQQAASECFGALEGGNPRRSEHVRQDMRKLLRQRHGAALMPDHLQPIDAQLKADLEAGRIDERINRAISGPHA